MSAQSDAISVGLDAARTHAGVTIGYHRGETDLSFSAIRGRRLPQYDDPRASMSYAPVSVEATDWLFPLSEFESLTGDVPAIGDTITESGGDAYALAAVEDGKHWRWVDPAQTWVRVHTVRTA